jgi:hypothetical protein
VSHQVGRKACLNEELHSKLHLKRKRGKSERWRRSSAGCERVQALAGEKTAKMLFGDSDREKSYTTREALHSQECRVQKALQGPLMKRHHELRLARKSGRSVLLRAHRHISLLKL